MLSIWESLSVTTHAIELTTPFDAFHPLIILLQVSGVTCYFDVYSLSIAEYILNIDLTAKNLHGINQQNNTHI